ncbi:DUF2141 domain-containing protein [Altererythrobacter sp.]|uniref:DUF2141 domain-containing protein n=1 Tax=Altererythrobacter sp. TaxID=1872480 RepID=UPI003D04C308
MKPINTLGWTLAALSGAAMALAAPVSGQGLYRNKIAHDMSKCAPGAGPAVRVTINGVKNSSGKIRVQSYRGTADDWLEKGKWINRIEAPAHAGTMTICMPLPASGTYGIAVRHDTNGNGKTDLREDGGGMSNNPSINIFNLGKPSYRKTAFTVNGGVQSISINMKYW